MNMKYFSNAMPYQYPSKYLCLKFHYTIDILQKQEKDQLQGSKLATIVDKFFLVSLITVCVFVSITIF